MNCWILQCNPNNWHWFDAVRDYGDKPDTWGINPQKNKEKLGKIKRDDTVFIWLSNKKGKRNRGIYAVAEITGEPDEKRKRFPYEEPYWINKEEGERLSNFPRLEIIYTNLRFINRPLLVNELKDAGLEDLSIIKNARGGLFEVTEKQCNAIKRMIESN